MSAKHYHFIGIGGIGMSGLARILLKQEAQVTGSDVASNYLVEKLVAEGAKIQIGHGECAVASHSTVVFSSAIKPDNPEFVKAKQLQCTLLHRSELLAQLTQGYKTLAVAGCHGKTTTSSLLASVLKKAKWDPAYALGGILLDFQANGDGGSGDYFVLEADESDGSFLNYSPYGAIVTNIDRDHMDFYGTEAAMHGAFSKFMSKVEASHLLFWCGDDSSLKALAQRGISYGFGMGCQLRAVNFVQRGWYCSFDVEFEGKSYKQVQLSMIGRHLASNALAVFGLCLKLGMPEELIREVFINFGGVGRRCEKKGEVNQVLFLDDYAHHPTEIAATLKGIRRAVGERRILLIFQPHRYSRTQDCLEDYASVFDEADLLWMPEIYAAGEKPIEGISSQAILDRVKMKSSLPLRNLPRSQIKEALLQKIRPHDVVVTMSAGDLNKLSEELVESFKKHPPRRLTVGVVCGGRSTEHEISLESACYFLNGLNPALYQIKLFGIARSGKWFFDKTAQIDQLRELLKEEDQDQIDNSSSKTFDGEILQELLGCDLFVPALHGTFGEDGTIQGLFEMLGKPYVGCDYRACAITMDKAFTKRIILTHGIPTAPFVEFNHGDWQKSSKAWIRKINKKLHYPLFVKPSHLGSTMGITKVLDPKDLFAAIEKALRLDSHILVEQGMVGREIEFAVVGNHVIDLPPPGEVITGGNVHTYETKYTDIGKTESPADLSKEFMTKGKKLALKAYRALGCTGLARLDFFLDAEGKYWLGEVNPMPGFFVPFSGFPKFWAAGGGTPAQLVDRLVISAFERKRCLDRLKFLDQ